MKRIFVFPTPKNSFPPSGGQNSRRKWVPGIKILKLGNLGFSHINAQCRFSHIKLAAIRLHNILNSWIIVHTCRGRYNLPLGKRYKIIPTKQADMPSSIVWININDAAYSDIIFKGSTETLQLHKRNNQLSNCMTYLLTTTLAPSQYQARSHTPYSIAYLWLHSVRMQFNLMPRIYVKHFTLEHIIAKCHSTKCLVIFPWVISGQLPHCMCYSNVNTILHTLAWAHLLPKRNIAKSSSLYLV